MECQPEIEQTTLMQHSSLVKVDGFLVNLCIRTLHGHSSHRVDTRRGHDGDSDRPVCTALRIWASTMIWDLCESNNLMVRMAMQFGIGDLANP